MDCCIYRRTIRGFCDSSWSEVFDEEESGVVLFYVSAVSNQSSVVVAMVLHRLLYGFPYQIRLACIRMGDDVDPIPATALYTVEGVVGHLPQPFRI